jgi:hypothetical protein
MLPPKPAADIEALNARLTKTKDKLKRIGLKSEKSAKLIAKMRYLSKQIGRAHMGATLASTELVERRLVAIDREWRNNEANSL